MENREGEGEEVVEERRKIERKRGRRKNQSLLSPMKVLSLKLRKKMLNTRQRLKTKVELAIKFSPLEFYHGSATAVTGHRVMGETSLKLANIYGTGTCGCGTGREPRCIARMCLQRDGGLVFACSLHKLEIYGTVVVWIRVTTAH
jgi:hypothetical protein